MRAALLILTAGLLAPACREKTPEIPLLDPPGSAAPVAAPEARPPAPAAAPQADQAPARPRVDPLGRLLPAEKTEWGFALPRGAVLKDESPDMIRYQVRATRQAVREFYAHRRHHVVRRGSGYQVLHSGETLKELEPTLESARLVIHAQARHVFSLRFFPPAGTRRAEVTSSPAPDDASATSPSPSRPSAVKSTAPRARLPRRTLRQEETFNPAHPRKAGVIQTRQRVENWKKKAPGRSFYD